MLVYALIALCLVLIGIAGLQFSYLFYIDRMYQERRKYLQALEQKCANLTARLDEAEKQAADLTVRLADLQPESALEDDAWADVIEER
ncbi:MAG TPA: hypothetical protein VNA17_01335 [Pyrinomonadaceae bacterium]|nr:hypothetical protein [Pyrinomonadaceae bacterium]